MFEYLISVPTENYKDILHIIEWVLGIIALSFLVACTFGYFAEAGRGRRKRPRLPDASEEMGKLLRFGKRMEGKP